MRTVLITGATGAIGSMLSRLLIDERDTRVVLLLRATSSQHLEERLCELYRFWGLARDDRATTSRVTAVAGDVTSPRLGVDEGTCDRLAGEVTHVIHSAGNVKLNRPVEEARRSAVDATRHIISFVDACRDRGRFRKLEFVSTVGVAGRMAGTVPERAFTAPRTFRNSYEAAKAEAETLLLEAMEGGLAATIHRPSMVVGDSTNGRIIQFQVFYYLCEFLSGRRTAGFIPRARDIRLDIVPVDYVARAIQLSSLRDDAAGRIFHLCAGPSDAPRIDDLARRIRTFFASRGRPTPALRPVPPALIRMALPVASALAPAKARRTLQSLPFFLAYLGEAQTFGNERAREFFAPAGVTVPAVDTYLETVLSYYLSRQSAS